MPKANFDVSLWNSFENNLQLHVGYSTIYFYCSGDWTSIVKVVPHTGSSTVCDADCTFVHELAPLSISVHAFANSLHDLWRNELEMIFCLYLYFHTHACICVMDVLIIAELHDCEYSPCSVFSCQNSLAAKDCANSLLMRLSLSMRRFDRWWASWVAIRQLLFNT